MNLYWQRSCNVEITTLDLQCLPKAYTKASNSQRFAHVASLLDSKLISEYIMDVLMAMSSQH